MTVTNTGKGKEGTYSNAQHKKSYWENYDPMFRKSQRGVPSQNKQAQEQPHLPELRLLKGTKTFLNTCRLGQFSFTKLFGQSGKNQSGFEHLN